MREREELASAFRALAAAGLSAASGLGNHLTMSVPPDYTSFLLNRYGLHWMEVTAENLVLVDADGNIVEGEGPVQGAAIALHGPVHAARRESARVIFHTHQPWFTALACIKVGGLRMFHPDACIYKDRVGFDPVYTGNWPMGHVLGSMSEGERLLRVPELKGKDICFLANHGTLQISSSIEEALFDCFNVERLCKEQVHAMMYASPFRELSADQVEALRGAYQKTRTSLVANYYDQRVRHNPDLRPLAGAWSGRGEVPLTFGVYSDGSNRDKEAAKASHLPTPDADAAPVLQLPATLGADRALAAAPPPLFDAAGGPASFMRHLVSEFEWSLRVDMAAVCRLISRLNGHLTYEGSFSHFSYDLRDGTYLVAPADIPFAAMRASHMVITDASGTVLRGSHFVDKDRFQAFNKLREAGSGGARYPMLLFTHTTFTDRLARHGKRIRMVSQSSFNFADEAYGYFDAWGHTLEASSEYTQRLAEHISEADKVFVMLSHGGCIARGEDAAHVFALVHGVDAAAEIQVYAEMTGFPLMEIDTATVRTFPRHNYGDMTSRTKRMVQVFAASKRLLLCDWNQGVRNSGDSAFVL